jgi:hypothetical protein
VTAYVDQLLFGYRNGHELVAGSRTLSAGAQRELLPHVDASLESERERDLIGISLPSLGAYMLARIWPAPELPRRGAVWTHALVVGFAELRTRGLRGLLSLLRRPSGDELEAYSERLPWPEASPARLAPPAASLAPTLVWAALGEPEGPRAVICRQGDERHAEDALVGLLDALPPLAREALSFRTRARARLERSPYRVQVAPALAGRSEESDAAVIDARRAPATPPPSWTQLLDDGPAAARLRDDLRRNAGSDADSLARVSAILEALVEGERLGLASLPPAEGAALAERALAADLPPPWQAAVLDALARVLEEDRAPLLPTVLLDAVLAGPSGVDPERRSDVGEVVSARHVDPGECGDEARDAGEREDGAGAWAGSQPGPGGEQREQR